jgi:AraC family transcriptional regulator of adaptative response / DNA-3-methyladenine glycosylase II
VSAPSTAPITVELATRLPAALTEVVGFLAAVGVPGVEEHRDGAYRRTLRLPGGPAVVSLTPGRGQVTVQLRASDPADQQAAVGAVRHLLDLDADPARVADHLGDDPHLGPLLAAMPGPRIPRTVDPGELAVRTVLDQQVSSAAGRTHAARLVAAVGAGVHDPDGGLTHLFPTAEQVARVAPDRLALPRTRRTALLGLARAVADGRVDLRPGADPYAARATLLELPGIGPWTAELLALRAVGDRDAFPASDLGVRTAAAALGLPSRPAALAAHAQRWRPERSAATVLLWRQLDHAVNRPPSQRTTSAVRSAT